MIDLQRRYWNRIADLYQGSTRISLSDFHYGPQLPGESQLQLLPAIRAGQRALELGCGGGQNSIWLARQGLECVAVDISRAQLRHATRLARQEGVSIDFVCSPLEELNDRVEGEFDLIHSAHAFEFISNPMVLVNEMAQRLAAGGSLVFSTVHPLYNGEWVEGLDLDGKPDGLGLYLRSYFEPPDDVRLRSGKVEAIARAYPVSRWFNWLRAAGLSVVQLVEPPALPEGIEPPYTSEAWAQHEGELHAIPCSIIFVAEKAGRGRIKAKQKVELTLQSIY